MSGFFLVAEGPEAAVVVVRVWNADDSLLMVSCWRLIDSADSLSFAVGRQKLLVHPPFVAAAAEAFRWPWRAARIELLQELEALQR